MNWDFGVDLQAVVRHIENSETFSIFFPMLRRSLLVDLRRGPDESPLIRVLPMVRSPHERLRSLRRLRPKLPRATQMVAIPWPIYVENLIRAGVWEKLARRVSKSGSAEGIRSLDAALAELRRLESQELAMLIRGDNYETIWKRER